MTSTGQIRDIEFVRQILSGDNKACKQFVEDYTDGVLYKVWSWMESHCTYSARKYVCCLLLFQQERKGGYVSAGNKVQCDECMDSYIWVFEYLKKKLKAYKGKNNCSLRTYVWSVINSHSMYIDWLRWRYGRVF